jgi:group I intron endonuclease
VNENQNKTFLKENFSCGVYKIHCLKNNKTYYGSAKNLKKRWKDHVRSLKEGKHHNKYLQKDYDKYGQNAFEFKVLESCTTDKNQRLKVEQKYINANFDDQKKCYNISKKATSIDGCIVEKNKLNARQINYIVENYGKMPASKISEKLNIKKQKIYKYCNKRGIKAGRSGPYEKITYNKKYFKQPNEENSFWAGFIVADGSFVENRTIKIDIAVKNKHLLEILARKLEYTGTIKNYINKSSSQGRLILYKAQRMITDIKNLQETTNQDHFKHFVSGYFLGKGSFAKSKNYGNIMVFSGQKELLTRIKNQFKIKSNPIRNQKSKNSYKLIIKGKKSAQIMKEELVDNYEFCERIENW